MFCPVERHTLVSSPGTRAGAPPTLTITVSGGGGGIQIVSGSVRSIILGRQRKPGALGQMAIDARMPNFGFWYSEVWPSVGQAWFDARYWAPTRKPFQSKWPPTFTSNPLCSAMSVSFDRSGDLDVDRGAEEPSVRMPRRIEVQLAPVAEHPAPATEGEGHVVRGKRATVEATQEGGRDAVQAEVRVDAPQARVVLAQAVVGEPETARRVVTPVGERRAL